MFILGLGSWDWYDNQMSEGRDIILGNPMWKFDHCRQITSLAIAMGNRLSVYRFKTGADPITQALAGGNGDVDRLIFLKELDIKQGFRYISITMAVSLDTIKRLG